MRKTNAVRRNCLRAETTPKQRFIDMACNSKSHAIKLWRVISVKFNIGLCVYFQILYPNNIIQYNRLIQYIQYNGFLRMETQHEVPDELFVKG